METRTIPGFPYYIATSEGTIFGKKGTLLPGWIDPAKGYLVLRVKPSGGGRKPMRIHALVALAFHGPKPSGAHVRHLDGNKLNNCPSNLAYGTPQENIDDMKRHGRSPIGSKHGMHKLVESDIPAIRSLRADGWTQKSIALRFNVTRGMIQLICDRKNWRHVS